VVLSCVCSWKPWDVKLSCEWKPTWLVDRQLLAKWVRLHSKFAVSVNELNYSVLWFVIELLSTKHLTLDNGSFIYFQDVQLAICIWYGECTLIQQQQQQLFYGPLTGQCGWADTRRNILHLLLYLSWYSAILRQFPFIYYDHSILPVQFICLTVFLNHLCPGPFWSSFWSRTLHFIPHTFLHPVIVSFSSLSTHAHTITTCFAAVVRLYHLFLISLWTFYILHYTSIWPFSCLLAEVPPHFLSLQTRFHFHATYYECCTVSIS